MKLWSYENQRLELCTSRFGMRPRTTATSIHFMNRLCSKIAARHFSSRTFQTSTRTSTFLGRRYRIFSIAGILCVSTVCLWFGEEYWKRSQSKVLSRYSFAPVDLISSHQTGRNTRLITLKVPAKTHAAGLDSQTPIYSIFVGTCRHSLRPNVSEVSR